MKKKKKNIGGNKLMRAQRNSAHTQFESKRREEEGDSVTERERADTRESERKNDAVAANEERGVDLIF